MAHVLITGGCGFIGSTLARRFRGEGWDVTCFDNLRRRGSEHILPHLQSAGCRFVHGDIRRPDDLALLRDDYQLLVDCCAEPSVLAGREGHDAHALVSINLGGTLELAEFARVRRLPFIFLSTSRVYPYQALEALPRRAADTRFEVPAVPPHVTDQGLLPTFPLDGPRTLYGASKLASELLLREYAEAFDLPVLINRCGVVAGPWQLGKVDQGFLTYWMAAHLFGRPLTYLGYDGTGRQVRDILHADDLADLLLAQAARAAEFRGQVFHAAGGVAHSVSLLETTLLCRAISGRDTPMGGSAQGRPADVAWLALDSRATRQAFGWSPSRDPRQTLEDIHRWLNGEGAALRGLWA